MKALLNKVTPEMVEAAANAHNKHNLETGEISLQIILQAALDAAPTVEVTLNSELEKLTIKLETEAQDILDNAVASHDPEAYQLRRCAKGLRVLMEKK